MENSKIKILHVAPTLNKGGAEKLIRDLLLNSDQKSFEHILVLIKKTENKKWENDLLDSGIKVYCLDKVGRWDWRSFWRLVKIIYQEKPAIIHSHLFLGHIFGRLGKIFYFNRARVLSTEQGLNPGEGGLAKLLRRATAFLSDKTAAISSEVARHTIEKEGVKKENCLIIPNGVSVVDFWFDGRDYYHPRPLVIGSVSRLERPKDFETFFHALFQLDKDSFVCKIAGDGSLKQDLIKLSKELGLEEKIEFVGMIDDVKNFLLGLDIFVLSSRSEGLGTVLLEAGLTGLPLVASRIGGILDIIENNHNGFLFDVGDSNELSGKLKVLLTSDSQRESYGLKARESIKSKFSLDKIVNDYESVYRVLSRG